MTFTAEPFILGGPTAETDLFNAGLTKALDEYCLSSSLAMINSAFPHTRMSLATFDGWQEPAAAASGPNWPDELTFLQSMRSLYGNKILFQNNGLAAQTCTGSPSSDMYCYMQSIPAPKGFQQGCGSKVTTCDQASVVDHALAFGGCFVEHSSWASLGAAQANYDARLKANPGCKTATFSPTPTTTATSRPTASPFPSSSPTPTANSADISGPAGVPDGRVNVYDLNSVLSHWGATSSPADITGPAGTPDGQVNIYDLNIVVSHWLG